MKKIILFLLIMITNYLNAQDITGDWNGILSVQGVELRIVFHISETNGQYTSTMDSPDQGASGIPMEETSFTDGTLSIKASALRMEYTARPNQDGSSLEGTFKQNGLNIPLNLSREAVEKKQVKRPQEPKVFPYQQEEITFVNPKGGHQLAGTLTIPEGGNFQRVVVLVTGSGPQNRDEELLQHKPFLVLSDYLTRNGIAVLRYDDRGVAASGGTFKGATSRDFADDAAAAIAYLKNRKDMEGKQFGIMGHSEGGMIAPIVASEDKTLDFIVLLAGPGINSVELLLLQSDLIAEAEGVPETARQINLEISRKAYNFIKDNAAQSKEKTIDGLRKILEEGYDRFSKEAQEEIGKKEDFIQQQITTLADDWFLYFMRFDPAVYLQKVNCPVLAVNGTLDLQVPAKENLEGIQKHLKVANNPNVTIKEFAGLNHLFQKTETGAPSEYAKLEETFNEEVMKYLAEWIHNYDKK